MEHVPIGSSIQNRYMKTLLKLEQLHFISTPGPNVKTLFFFAIYEFSY
jgi:hypothetical protein